MVNLNTLAIDGFDAKNLDENVFESLTNLKNITLSGTNFNDIPENIFKRNPKKLNYIYVLTPKGIAEKTKLTLNFMKRKMREYDELKSELKKR